MSNAKTPFQSELLKQAEQRSSARSIGFEEGRAATERALAPQVEKLASDAVQTILGDAVSNEELRGQVAVHSAGREVQRAKQSMANGYCWDCGVTKISSTSKYRRCAVCDANDPDEATQ